MSCLKACVASTLMLLCMSTAHADSMRCGKWVVNESEPLQSLLSKCGEPQRKEVREDDIRVRNHLGALIKVGVQTTERWIYQPSRTSLERVVTVVDGKVRSVE